MPGQDKYRILLAEDDAFARKFVSSILTTSGHSLSVVEDGQAAFEAYQAAPETFDLIISDMDMPHKGGLDLVCSLRALGREVPVIIITGDMEINTALQAIRSGANDYVLKDKDIASSLTLSLGRVMEKERYVQQNRTLLKEVESLARELAEKNSHLESYNRGLLETVFRLSLIGASLMAEKDLDALLEVIVLEGLDITNSDGCTLYTLEGDKLKFRISKNKSLDFFIGGRSGSAVTFSDVPLVESNVSAFSALHKRIVSIPDVYTSTEFDFSGPKNFDKEHGYRTASMLVIPMVDRNDTVIGVLQFVNMKDPETGALGPYDDRLMHLGHFLACQASVSIENARGYETIKRKNLSFKRFVPTEFLQFLGHREAEEIELGDVTTLELSVLFSDIRSFTQLSERMSPRENFDFINNYLSIISPLIMQNGGFIDKYIGDAVMALFAGRVSGSADDALASAVAMQEAMRAYNARRAVQGQDPIRIGIGINTGALMLGTVGFEERMDTTVIGDTVNIASRVEQITKEFGISVAATAATIEKLKKPDAVLRRPLGSFRIKGKETPVTMYEVFNADPPPIRDSKVASMARYDEALECLVRGRQVEALQLFESLSLLCPEDIVVERFLADCRRIR